MSDDVHSERPGDALPKHDPSSSTPSSELLEQLSGRSSSTRRYTLDREVARGGMGAILRVWDADLRRHLAMKVMLADRADVDDKTLARFLEEAQVTGQLDHPGVVPVHELGVDEDGRVFFTMRLVKGRDLKAVFELVRNGDEGWNRTRALGVLMKACEALAYAHSHGVIHRDLKPSNIMVGRFGEVYVMDWGLARVKGRSDNKDLRLQTEGLSSVKSVQSLRRDEAEATPDSPLITMDGDVMGTPAYMSPEQARGNLDELGPRSDVYAMGAILYELLVGHMPYLPPELKRSPRMILAAVQDGPPRSLASSGADAPAELEAICERAMHRDAGQRYADVTELADDLRAYMEGRVVRAHRTGAVIELRKWGQRNKALAAAVLIALGAVVGALFVSSNALSEARAERADAEHAGYLANIRLAAAAIKGNDITTARRALDSCPPEQRAWEWHHLDLESDSSISQITAPDDWLRYALLSPDGRLIATSSTSGAVRLWDADSGELLRTLEGHQDVSGPLAFSGDGARLVSGSHDHTLRLWDVSTGESLATLRGHAGSVTVVDFSSDGRRIVSNDRSVVLRLWDGESGDFITTLTGHEGRVYPTVFSPDGRFIASGGSDSSVRLWDASTGAALQTLTGHAGHVWELRFSPDSQSLASGSSDSTIMLWDVATGHRLSTLKGHEQRVVSIAFHPDGHSLVSGATDDTLRLWDLDTGWLIAQMRGHNGAVTSVAFDADGTHIVSSSHDTTLRMWDGASGSPLGTLRGSTKPLYGVAFSPDGTRLLSSAWDGSVRLWDTAAADLRSTSRQPANSLWTARYGPRGERIVSLSPGASMLSWDANSGALLGSFEGGPADINDFEFSPDGQTLATASDDHSLGLWNLSTRQRTATLQGHTDAVLAVIFNHDGSQMLSRSKDNTVRLWDTKTGATLLTLDDHARSISFSPDGTRMLTGTDGAARLRDSATGKLLGTLGGHNGPVKIARFSPNGRRIVTAAKDRDLFLWDADGAVLITKLQALEGARNTVLGVRFSPDGTRLVSFHDDPSLRLWRVEDGALLATLRGHQNTVMAARFTPDGARILSGSMDDTLRVWEGSTGEPLLTLPTPESWVISISIHPQGTSILTGTQHGRMTIWPSTRAHRQALWDASRQP